MKEKIEKKYNINDSENEKKSEKEITLSFNFIENNKRYLSSFL